VIKMANPVSFETTQGHFGDAGRAAIHPHGAGLLAALDAHKRSGDGFVLRFDDGSSVTFYPTGAPTQDADGVFAVPVTGGTVP
jgi:hypothetical protein